MRLNVLMINNISTDSEALKSALLVENCHATVEHVHTIKDAITTLDNIIADVLVIKSEDDKAVEVAKELLHTPELLNTPFVFMLEYSNPDLKKTLQELNVKYIIKSDIEVNMLASYLVLLTEKACYKEQLTSMGSYMKDASIVCEKDADGDFIFTYINKAFLELEEGNVNNILGRKLKDSHLLFGIKNLIVDIQEVYDTKAPIHLPNYFYMKDGHREWSDVYIYSSHPEQVSIISSSLSEVKKAHDKATQSSRYLQTVLNAQHHVIYITDGTKLINTNQAFLDFFGCDTMHAFIKEHGKVCNIFEEATEPFYINTNEPFWHKKVAENTQERYKLRIRHDDIVKVFIPSVQVIMVEEKEQFVVVLTDVSELESEKEKLRFLAMSDALTGVPNRLKFNTMMDNFMEQSKRYETPLSLVMLDIDHFKALNENFSHKRGDEVLKTLATLVAEEMRKVDLFVRWGGEEFLMVLPNTNIDNALVVAEKIHTLIGEYLFDEVGKITCSFGVTQMKDQESVSDLVARVEESLYEAKKAGRNRIRST